jgi:hypothetical protein
MMENDSKMVLHYGGNEYEIVSERIKAEIACILLPETVRSTMAKEGDVVSVICRFGKTSTD